MNNKPTLEAQAYMQLRTTVTQRYGELQQLRAQGVAAAAAGDVDPAALARVDAAQAAWAQQLQLLADLRLRYVNSAAWSALEVAHELTELLNTSNTAPPLQVRSIAPPELLWLVASVVTYLATHGISVTLVVVLVAALQILLRRQTEAAAHYAQLEQTRKVRRDAIEAKRQRLGDLMELPVAHEMLSWLEARYQQERVPQAQRDAIRRAQEATKAAAESKAADEAKAAANVALAAAERQCRTSRFESNGTLLDDSADHASSGGVQYTIAPGSYADGDSPATAFQDQHVWQPEPLDYSYEPPESYYPEFNTNGIPMVSNSFVDVQGHTFGQDW